MELWGTLECAVDDLGRLEPTQTWYIPSLWKHLLIQEIILGGRYGDGVPHHLSDVAAVLRSSLEWVKVLQSLKSTATLNIMPELGAFCVTK